MLAPALLEEWAVDLNGGPGGDVLAGSDRMVWWRCAQGHEWQTRLVQRARRRTRCPFCAGRWATPERNLAVLYPQLAGQWHPELNDGVDPQHVPPQSNRRAWWQCSQGHEWQARVAARSGGGTGCPGCRRAGGTPSR